MEKTAEKKRVLSLLQPTGVYTLGNYLGSLRNFVPMQEEYECLFGIADLHSITVRQTPADLRKAILNSYALNIAIGLDPEKSVLFIQSQVPEHAQLGWVLQCFTQFGELSRMTQFKDKSQKHPENINAGLFTYPSLMAADILLYQADFVPVGNDQNQHIEITRDIAERFNGIYSPTFKVPEGLNPKNGARIMSLLDPTKKMSKSDPNKNGTVLLLDSKDEIVKKFKRAVTDSEARVCRGEGKDGINNLIDIYSCVTGKTADEVEIEFQNTGYGDFKLAVGEAVADKLAPIQKEHEKLLADKAYLEQCYKDGAEKAHYIARKTLSKVMRKIGFI